MASRPTRALLVVAALCAAPAFAAPPQIQNTAPSGGTELTWYGHAAFRLKTPSGKVLLIDPWITNPANAAGKDNVAKLDKVDLILISHGHSDHVGDAVEIAKKTGAKLVGNFDLGQALVSTLGFPKDKAGMDTQGNFGGDIPLLDGEVTVTLVPAVHSSGVTASGPQGKGPPEVEYGGAPSGFVIRVRNGPVVYHTGDTDLFSDMSLIGRYQDVTVMLACIGDHFTMGPDRAAEAVKLVHPKTVIPMHFGTFPVLTGTADAFSKALQKAGVSSQLRVMKIGETIKL